MTARISTFIMKVDTCGRRSVLDEVGVAKEVEVTHTLLDWALLVPVLQLVSQYYHREDCPISSIIEGELGKEMKIEEELGKETSSKISDIITGKNHFDDRRTLTIKLTKKQSDIVGKYYRVVDDLKSWGTRKKQLMDSGAE